ncbi:MAG: 4-demethylwyosine synthase TYW1 [Candidatus Thermoplasmatota archaeon]|nr:4-demethylwyosine synthase TYW1 [Candidatus Thermoplasmatota archaeon]
MDDEVRKIFQRQHYKIIGVHSGVKLCHWMRQKLFYGRVCYKEFFYGMQSHRCLQITPAISQCTQNCLYCWRYQGATEPYLHIYDEPELILEEGIKAQRLLLSGFKGDERCNLKLWREAQEPNHVAISLAGEPTLYPKLGALIALCNKKGMTSFLVTNGTVPESLEKLSPLPTQLYITISAPNKIIYKKLCNPIISNGWSKIKASLEILRSLDTRTVIRHTLVDGWNICNEEQYAKLDCLAEPDFIECKAYMFVGSSRQRMALANMPSHTKIKEFAEKLSSLTGYRIAMEKEDSRVVLLTKKSAKKPISLRS